MAFPERARLLAIATDTHRAPDARLILRAVVEGPSADLGPASLQPCPTAVSHRGGNGAEDAAERVVDAPRLRVEHRSPAREAKSNLGSTRGAVQHGRRGTCVKVAFVVREQQLA